MTWKFHILRLQKINEKMQRGEEPTEREIAYVKALWKKIRPILQEIAATMERAYGLSVSEIAAHAKKESALRQKEVVASRDAARNAMAQMYRERKMR